MYTVILALLICLFFVLLLKFIHSVCCHVPIKVSSTLRFYIFYPILMEASFD